MVGAFPAQPEADEIAYLESIAKTWRRAEPGLVRQAVALCKRARAELAERKAEPSQKESANLKELGAQLAAPEMKFNASAEPAGDKETNKGEFNFSFNFDLGFGDAAEDPELKDLPDTSKLPLDAALRLARSQNSAGQRAAMLTDLLDGRSAALEPRIWASIAEEAVRESGHMRPSAERLILLAELACWSYQHGEKALAGAAAQSLVPAFDRFVNCDQLGCAIFRSGGAPGQVIASFADYLRKAKIEPRELGLHHPSLEARWLLGELQALLEDESGGKPDAARPESEAPGFGVSKPTN